MLNFFEYNLFNELYVAMNLANDVTKPNIKRDIEPCQQCDKT